MIPTAFLFSTIGYPFILPDMIGGNVYNNEELPSKVEKNVPHCDIGFLNSAGPCVTNTNFWRRQTRLFGQPFNK